MDDRRITMRMGGDFQLFWFLFAVTFWVGGLVALCNTHSGSWVLPLGVACVIAGAVVEGRALAVVTRVEPEGVFARNHLRTWRVPYEDIALVLDHVAVAPLDRTYTRRGRLELLTWTGTAVPLAGTSGTDPTEVTTLVRAIAAAAPHAHLSVDLTCFPHSRSRQAGIGHLGPVPEKPPVRPRAEVDAEVRRRQDEGRAHLDQLRRDLDEIQAAKRT